MRRTGRTAAGFGGFVTAIRARVRARVRQGVPLQELTTFRIGGPAGLLVEPEGEDDLKLLLRLAKRYTIPCFLLGSGSNILAADRGIRGMVLRLSSPYFKRVKVEGRCIEAGGGAPLARIIRISEKHGLGGLEFLAGIPGTLGGALAMNAGVKGSSVADVFQEARVMGSNGAVRVLSKDEVRFGYRASSLSRSCIISARLKLKKDVPADIRARVRGNVSRRLKEQDYSLPSAGCVFRNPGVRPAGKLIDLCGFKGRCAGDACVSLKHANFIVNRGKARSRDVERLMGLIQEKVYREFGVRLKPEIKIWG